MTLLLLSARRHEQLPKKSVSSSQKLVLVPGRDKALFSTKMTKTSSSFWVKSALRKTQLTLISQTAHLSVSFSKDVGFLQVSWLRKKLWADSRRKLRGRAMEARERKNWGSESITAVWETERRRLFNYQMCDGVRWRFLALQVWMSNTRWSHVWIQRKCWKNKGPQK